MKTKVREETIGTRIEDLRQKAGLSMHKVGEAAGVSRSAVSLWVSGKTLPRKHHISKIAELFGVSEIFLEYGYVMEKKPKHDTDLADKIRNLTIALRDIDIDTLGPNTIPPQRRKIK